MQVQKKDSLNHFFEGFIVQEKYILICAIYILYFSLHPPPLIENLNAKTPSHIFFSKTIFLIQDLSLSLSHKM